MDNERPLILVVVVLYCVRPEEAETVRGLEKAFAQHPGFEERYRVLLWDNSPEMASAVKLEFPFAYHHAPQNEGVSGAYNRAAGMAEAEGLPWLLLLDQDTSVTTEFFSTMAEHARSLLPDEQVAAAVPFLFAGQLQLSPRYVRFARHVPIPATDHGLQHREMFAANSGCLLRVAALRQLGGYSLEFWLDFSDIEMFRRLHEQGKSVFIAADARLQHEIAMLDYDRRMTPARYQNFLLAEGAYHDLYKGRWENACYLLRLLLRAFRQRRLLDGGFSRLARKALVFRLGNGRRRRLQAWKQANQERRGLH